MFPLLAGSIPDCTRLDSHRGSEVRSCCSDHVGYSSQPVTAEEGGEPHNLLKVGRGCSSLLREEELSSLLKEGGELSSLLKEGGEDNSLSEEGGDQNPLLEPDTAVQPASLERKDDNQSQSNGKAVKESECCSDILKSDRTADIIIV